MNWCERLTGFTETTYEATRSKLKLKLDHGRLRSLVNDRTYGIGALELVSFQELRERVQFSPDPSGRRLTVRLYATDLDEKYRTSERAVFRDFLQKVINLDKRKTTEKLVWDQFSGSIGLLLDNRFIFQDFWNYRNGKIKEAQYFGHFADANKAAKTALARLDTATVLSIVLSHKTSGSVGKRRRGTAFAA